MSSYFDTMSRCFANPEEELPELVYRQMRAHIQYLGDECLARERDKVYGFSRELERLHVNLVDQVNHTESLALRSNTRRMFIENCHDLGHNIGRAVVRLKGGRIATDNPRIII